MFFHVGLCIFDDGKLYHLVMYHFGLKEFLLFNANMFICFLLVTRSAIDFFN